MKMRRTLAVLGLTALVGIPLACYAFDASSLGSADPGALVNLVLDAVQHGNLGLAVVVALLCAVRVAKMFAGDALARGVKALLKLDDATASDVSGHIVLFVVTALVMVAGPLASGMAFSGAVIKTALLTALATSGGWSFLKQFVHPLFANVPIVGWVLEMVTGRVIEGALPKPADSTPPVAPLPPSNDDTHTGP